jgi:Pyruvate/2-oxoacid:ferredoxin oxidoreductase delta subunit
MAKMLLTEQQADRIITARKSINTDVEWGYRVNEGYAKCQLTVSNPLGMNLNLKVYGNVNMEEPTIFSFSLILSNAYRIRGLDTSGSHKNKHTDSNEWRGKTHKHKWSDRCREAFAYTPEETIPSDDITQGFKAFCKECNIDFAGEVRPLPPKQLGMKI